jgi:hypothetical protein
MGIRNRIRRGGGPAGPATGGLAGGVSDDIGQWTDRIAAEAKARAKRAADEAVERTRAAAGQGPEDRPVRS